MNDAARIGMVPVWLIGRVAMTRLASKTMKLIRRQIFQIVGATIAILGINAPSLSAEPNVVGNWKLVTLVEEDLATGRKTDLLGEHPKGYLIYTPQGRMMGLIVHDRRSPPQTDEDRINLHKYMVAYSGRYTVEGDKVVHHVDISWNETLTGTDLVRFVKLEGNKLTITTAPARNSISGLYSVSVLVWEREH